MTNVFVGIKPKPAPRPRFSRRGTYNPKDYTDYKEVIRLAYVAVNKGYPCERPIAMKLEFFFKIPKSWSKAKKDSAKWHISRPDGDNLAKSIKDALNGVAYRDDSQVCFLQVRKQYAQFDGVKIEIEEIL